MEELQGDQPESTAPDPALTESAAPLSGDEASTAEEGALSSGDSDTTPEPDPEVGQPPIVPTEATPDTDLAQAPTPDQTTEQAAPQVVVADDPMVLPVRRFNERNWTACVLAEDRLFSPSLTFGEPIRKSALGGDVRLLTQYELQQFM